MNGNVKTKKYGKYMFVGVAFFIICLFLCKYRAQKREIYMEKAEKYQNILQTEKEWIQKNQGVTGEIYLNSPYNDRTSGDVNPYFACQAARGMLCGEIMQEQLQGVGAYLSWHSEKLVEHEGEICNYRMIKGELLPTGEYDSVDAYLAVFLSLVVEYDKSGGNLSEIQLCEKAVDISIETLEKITLNGLTHVSPENKVAYFMDNAEVADACKKMSEMLQDEDSSSRGWAQRDKKALYFHNKAYEIEQGITQELWNEREHRFEIGLDAHRWPLEFKSWKKLYPDAASQIYSVAYDVYPQGKNVSKKLYETMCNEIKWQHLDTGNEFGWPVLAYIALKLNDIQSAEIFLDNYVKQADDSREYPYHTADAAWIARTCDLLFEYYTNRSCNRWNFSAIMQSFEKH